jgi:hypothetical protein
MAVIAPDFVTTLADEDRRTVVLMMVYQELRRRYFEMAYNVVGHFDADTLETAKFKQFARLRLWLEQRGWMVRMAEEDWKGYLKFAFAEFGKRRDALPPVANQMMNPVLVKKYMHQTPTKPGPVKRTQDDLAELYARIIRDDFLDAAT